VNPEEDRFMMPLSVAVKVWGEFALFTRPELKVERLSYPTMTPSVARGVLDAILYRPEMCWHVRRITALEPRFPAGFPEQAARRPYRLVGIRRNEIQGKIAPRTVEGWMKDPATVEPYLVDSAGREGVQGQNRTQRNSLVLQHVAYRIDATPLLTERANRPRARPEDEEDGGPDTVAKYVAMFRRRVAKGQCFHRPYLGCREFACHFAEPDGGEKPLSDWSEKLGLMLYDLRFGADGVNRPGFFDAEIIRGVLHCDTTDPGPNDEPPVRVLGWD
jgi:CRISPR-associated protein Cas5d